MVMIMVMKMIMVAGDKGIERFDPMNEAMAR